MGSDPKWFLDPERLIIELRLFHMRNATGVPHWRYAAAKGSRANHAARDLANRRTGRQCLIPRKMRLRVRRWR
jgi:hypothetical protein